MKKAIIIIVVVAMFGYAVYEFVDRDTKTTSDNNDDKITATGPGMNKDQTSNEENTNEENTNDEDNAENDGEPTVGLKQGNIAPDFELELLETGEQVQLSDYRGNKVMLNFWASWCGPCRAEMPDMEKLHNNEDVAVLAVNLASTEKNSSDITDFVEEFELTFDVLLDETNEVATLYAIKPIPTSYLIDEDGIIQNMAQGALNYEMMIQGFEMMD